MSESVFGFLNVLVSFFTAHMIKIYPLWNTLGWKKRGTFLYLFCLTLYITACYMVATLALGLDKQGLQLLKLYITIPSLFVVFWLYRRQVWQIIFLIALAFMYGPINTGIGIFATAAWFPAAHTLLTESVVTLVVSAFTLPPLLILLRRLCNNPNMKQAVIFWRFIWLLPACFFAVTIMTSSYLDESEKDIGFLMIRIVMYCAMLLICYLLEKAVRQIAAAETAKREAAKLAERTDFYHQMAHDLLTPLTVVSTNVQRVEKHPEEGGELMRESQEEIMRMAEMIKNTLDDESDNI